ncbi:DUF3800 domain-containing protein [Dyadobacter sediminis]|uniref:DUF3800 domain-containing protein n=1 Tax=Dyadobacter sediminis TaxID=1493691 RepID=A0A5R9KKS0_9BACT|nr:DUF3800 domain-containing protein [Dyadobacter sediminis]TLU96646.1 DUF3800 domain-containing protein [Dyadobacter sediminis]GGB84004.1 hypothetical protein GCM10011325_09470 [Dyadobacter sediminis]
MHNHLAFLDYWGNNSLDFKNKSNTRKKVSTHFIVTALIIPKQQLSEVSEVVHNVQQKYFTNGRIDTRMTGNNHKLRKQILEELATAPFQIFALIVDKRQLVSEGLRYKGSFYKFMHGLADRELFRVFPDLEMMAAAEQESDSFMSGFIHFVQQTHIPNLFNESAFGFVQVSHEEILQAAGYLADTLARCYDEAVLSDQRREFVQVLQPRLLTIRFWPDVFLPDLVRTNAEGSGFNKTLAELSVNKASDFLQQKAPSQTLHIMDQHTTLSYLLFHFRHINPLRYISSFELMEHIKTRHSRPVSLHYFQTKVIAPLRDAGVLIASSSRGYKLPACEADLYDFVNHSNAIIEPMLSRVRKFRDSIRAATNGELDVLASEEYSLIRKGIE